MPSARWARILPNSGGGAAVTRFDKAARATACALKNRMLSDEDQKLARNHL